MTVKKKGGASIRVGIGGWDYPGWRGLFYPPELPQRLELQYAASRLGAIEINGTYYRTQKPESFAKWRDQAPDGFQFAVKASRYATNRKVLAEAGESVERFLNSGLVELGDKLGPLLWQFAPSKRFDPHDMEAFVQLLPAQLQGRTLRHVLDVRHASFADPAFLALARKYKAAVVFTDSADYPSLSDLTADFVYARLMNSKPQLKTGYTRPALDAWSQRARLWAAGGEPQDLPRVEAAGRKSVARDVFLFFINGAKERAPAAATALIERLQ
jgi:uncharacterized protein YecE (DUF72 family)